jgi:hypothetical protein
MKYRTVDDDFWGDPWIENLDVLSKLLFLYLFTTSRQTNCGAFQVTVRTISYETGMSPEAVRKCMAILCEEEHVSFWPDINTVFVRAFYKNQRAKSSYNFTISAQNDLLPFPSTVQERVLQVYPELLHPSLTPPIPMGIPSPTPPQAVSKGVAGEGEGLRGGGHHNSNNSKDNSNNININKTEHFLRKKENAESELESLPESATPVSQTLVGSDGTELEVDWEALTPQFMQPPSAVEAYLMKNGREVPPPKAERKNGQPKAPLQTPFPAHFHVEDEYLKQADEEGLVKSVDVIQQTNLFVEFYTKGEGQGVLSKNWQQRWITWMRGAKERVEAAPAYARNGRKAVRPHVLPTPVERLEIGREPELCSYPGCDQTTFHPYCSLHGIFPQYKELKAEYQLPEKEEEDDGSESDF